MDPAGDRAALNLKQVATVLGVHYMTVYRYVRSGRLPARRDGNVWLVDAADVAAFTRAAGQRVEPGPAAVDWVARLRAPLVAGDGVGAWQTVEAALVAGWDAEAVLVGMVEQALATITDDDGPAAGHLAATTAQRTTAVLTSRFRRAGRDRGQVVLGAPVGEAHALGLSLIADLLRLRNIGVRELGVGVPTGAFADAVAGADRLVAVAVGVTSAAHTDAAAEVIAAVRAVAPGVPVILGGQAVRNPEVAAATGATSWAARLEEVADQVEALLPASRSRSAAPADR